MHPPDLIGSFEERQFPDFRNATIDSLIWGSKRYHIPILPELDVTAARDAIRDQKKMGQRISFITVLQNPATDKASRMEALPVC